MYKTLGYWSSGESHDTGQIPPPGTNRNYGILSQQPLDLYPADVFYAQIVSNKMS